jgi:hypothetical protein
MVFSFSYWPCNWSKVKSYHVLNSAPQHEKTFLSFALNGREGKLHALIALL